MAEQMVAMMAVHWDDWKADRLEKLTADDLAVQMDSKLAELMVSLMVVSSVEPTVGLKVERMELHLVHQLAGH